MANNWFTDCYRALLDSPLASWLETLPADIARWQRDNRHGHFDKWCKLLDRLPDTLPSQVVLDTRVEIGRSDDISDYQQKQIRGLLQRFMPWRKGPFYLHGIHIDTEWRSDWKWDRVRPHIQDLSGRHVLDVGCGSGYHLWRMRGEDAALTIGIDPTPLFLVQFQAIKHFNPDPRVHMLPLGIEHMPELNAFDTVFSMGVLYHRKSPMDFLLQLRQQLRKGGELVLETLVVEGDKDTVFMPQQRYAQMNNVWFLPSTDALILWLTRSGFSDIRVADIDVTRLDEQRATEWMEGQSLQDFLDPQDHSKTIEGYPAPRRAVLIATAC